MTTPESTPGPELRIYDIIPTHPDGFGGHVFEYEGSSDLFKCVNEGCGAYEFIAREGGGITTCPGAST